jgi:asparagine synthase (glutamine-hydrolysing)
MCGITGLLDLDGAPIKAEVLVAMRDALTHRGPDAHGIWMDGAVGLGHRRLSIIDIDGGSQPMADASGQIVVTYNGEIYNFAELRERLEGLGHQFRTASDTEVLIEAYREWGEDAVARFNGMFAFGLWDARERKLLLARDRLGIKPLYWTRVGRAFAFASENKAFMAHPDFVAEADLDAVSSYLTFRQAVWDICFFRNVHKLPPGHVLTLKSGEISTRPYWRLPVGRPGEDRGEAFYLERCQDLLTKAVDRRTISDVPLGAYLSGGVDSSIVAALMGRTSSGPVQTFSIGYGEDGYDEGRFAQLVSDHIGSAHRHFVLEQEDYLESWRDLIRHNDIPLSIPHEIALHRLSREMKSSITVALSGEGADELFGGYGRVQRSPMDWKKVRAARSILGRRLAGRIADLPGVRDSAGAWLGLPTQMDHFFAVYNWVPFEEKWSWMTDDALDGIGHDRRTLGVFQQLFDDSRDADPYDRVFHVMQKVHLGCLLDRLDMMSMASGLEARVPFVDHELIEFVVQMPRRHKMRWNSWISGARALFYTSHQATEWLDTNKVMLRRIAARLVPAEIANRKKLGFPTPLDQWMGSEMMPLARDLLLDRTARERGIFRPEQIEALLSNPQALPYDFYGKKVWMLMNVELWFREVIGRPQRSSPAA